MRYQKCLRNAFAGSNVDSVTRDRNAWSKRRKFCVCERHDAAAVGYPRNRRAGHCTLDGMRPARAGPGRMSRPRARLGARGRARQAAPGSSRSRRCPGHPRSHDDLLDDPLRQGVRAVRHRGLVAAGVHAGVRIPASALIRRSVRAPASSWSTRIRAESGRGAPESGQRRAERDLELGARPLTEERDERRVVELEWRLPHRPLARVVPAEVEHPRKRAAPRVARGAARSSRRSGREPVGEDDPHQVAARVQRRVRRRSRR